MENKYKVEKAFEKFIKKMLSEKYPMFLFLDVQVVYVSTRDSYEVFLIILEEDWDNMSKVGRPIGFIFDEIRDYIINLAKYMDIKIRAVFREVVSEEEWKKIKFRYQRLV